MSQNAFHVMIIIEIAFGATCERLRQICINLNDIVCTKNIHIIDVL